jgi:hypothetical protein
VQHDPGGETDATAAGPETAEHKQVRVMFFGVWWRSARDVSNLGDEKFFLTRP